jgi:hypothetical protein
MAALLYSSQSDEGASIRGSVGLMESGRSSEVRSSKKEELEPV